MTKNSVFQPRYSMAKIPIQVVQEKEHEEVERPKNWFYVTCCFVSSTLAACSSLYTADSIAA